MFNSQILNTFVLTVAAEQNLTSLRPAGSIVGPIAKFLGKFYNMLFDMIHGSISVGALGVAIILFTLIVKMILFPLMVNQQKSSAKMQTLQPEMNKIRDKYKGKNDQLSQQKMSLELQDFQKKNGANMLGGCLPLLVQLPILYALFFIFQNAYMYIDVVAQNYLDIADLILEIPTALRMEAFAPYAQEFADANAKMATIKANGFDMGVSRDIVMLVNYLRVDDWTEILKTLGASGDALVPLLATKNGIETFLTIPLVSKAGLMFPGILVPLLAGITTFIQSKITMAMTPQPEADPNNPNPAMAMTKSMTYAMPFMMGFICISMPAGLGLYWIISNIFGIIQTVILQKVFKKKFAREVQ